MSIPAPLPTVSLPDVHAAQGATAYVYLAGVGSVGSTLLRQIAARSSDDGPVLHVIGACTHLGAIWNGDPDAVPLEVPETSGPPNWREILDVLIEEAPRPLIFVDATGSEEVARFYAELLETGVHVVTPSKIANTRSQDYFDRLEKSRGEATHYRYETTVGAGLPVVQTVHDLCATGDHIRSIRGVVSGTLSFIFNALREGQAFSKAVREAAARGYAEPDVRIDLSGEDVARKFMILARTAGFRLERSQVEVESLVPEELRDLSPEVFRETLASVDPVWQERRQAAAARSAVLQYVGTFEGGAVRIGVEEVDEDDPLGRLEGTDNLIALHTDRYAHTPLIVQGPGAGPEVTAAGVLADVLKVARAVTGLSA